MRMRIYTHVLVSLIRIYITCALNKFVTFLRNPNGGFDHSGHTGDGSHCIFSGQNSTGLSQ